MRVKFEIEFDLEYVTGPECDRAQIAEQMAEIMESLADDLSIVDLGDGEGDEDPSEYRITDWEVTDMVEVTR